MAKVQYTIRLEESTFEKAKEIADKDVRSLNNLFEFFITKGIEAYSREEKERQSFLSGFMSE